MDKGTGFNITIGANMQVTSSTSDASINIFTIIPKVQDENVLSGTVLSHLFIHQFTLLRCCQEGWVSILPYWNICEVPPEKAPFFNHCINKLLRGNLRGILRVVT